KAIDRVAILRLVTSEHAKIIRAESLPHASRLQLNMMEANECEQYRAAIHGDRDAFEMIIRTHSRALFAIAYGILQNREEAEDAVQDALIKAWKSRWRVRDPAKSPAWLAMIARYRARDMVKRRRNVPLSDAMTESLEHQSAGVVTATSLAPPAHSALAALPDLPRSR